MELLIRQLGRLIDVSVGGVDPVPEPALSLLQSQLTYTHKKMLHGADQYRPDGTRQRMLLKVQHMFNMHDGRLTTTCGFIPRITRVLSQVGHAVRYANVSPPRRRPRCYETDWENLTAHFVPRPRQLDCLRAIADNQCGLIDASMGFGKSHMTEAVCRLFPHAKVAIVVGPKDVAAKIVSQLTKAFPGVGHIGGGKNVLGQRITVFTAGSMHRSDGDFDILLCDEAHQLMTPQYAVRLAENFPDTRNYGFTATPDGRADGAGARLEMLFGVPIFKLSYSEAVSLGLVVPMHVHWIPLESDYNPAAGKSGVPQLRWGIWRNEFRNAAFAAHVRANVGQDEQVLMSVATLDHAIHLWRHLPEFWLCYSNVEEKDIESYKRSGLLPAGFEPMTPKRREQLRKAFEAGQLKRVIATDVWSTGVDFAQLQWLYRCDARESATLSTQWPGRVSRLHDGKSVGRVVDSIDMWDSTFKRKSQTRRKHYRAQGWTDDWPRTKRQVNRV